MVIDLRKQPPQKRTIKIVISNDRDVDHYVDKILEDLDIILKQRRYAGTTKINIEIK
jgi:hypothetical protein